MGIEDAQKILKDIPRMKKFHKDYNWKTARDILGKLYESWEASAYRSEGRWGPGIVSKIMGVVTPTTIGRYFRAFHKAGIEEIKIEVDDGEEIIPIPHKFK